MDRESFINWLRDNGYTQLLGIMEGAPFPPVSGPIFDLYNQWQQELNPPKVKTDIENLKEKLGVYPEKPKEPTDAVVSAPPVSPAPTATPTPQPTETPKRKRDLGDGWSQWEELVDNNWVAFSDPFMEEDDPGGMTAYQQASLAQSQSQFDVSTVLQQQQLAFQKQQAMASERARKEELELERQRQLAEYKSSPRDWITAWEFEHGKTPAQTQAEQQQLYQESPYGQRDLVQSYIADTQYARDQAVASGDEVTAAQMETNLDVYENWATQIQQTIAQDIGQAQTTGTPMFDLTPAKGQASPTAPAGTEWISQLTQNWQPGKPISGGYQPRVASGQLWNQIPWSQRQMFGGLLESKYSKGIPSFRDYEEMVASRLPKPAERKTRWQPSIQR